MRKFLFALLFLLVACAGYGVRRAHLTQITTFDRDGQADSIATGWFIASRGGFSIVATAGHVCEGHGLLLLEDSLAEERVGIPVYIDYDPGAGRDGCLVLVSGGAPLVLRAGTIPDVFGARVWYAGYPMGVLSVFEGRLSGHSREGQLAFSMPIAPGASGSPIVRDGRAVSMVIAVNRGFASVGYGIDSPQLIELQGRADEFLRLMGDET